MKRICVVISMLFLLLSWAAPGYAQQHPEKRLIQAIEAIQAVRLDDAERLLKALINDEPEFKLARLRNNLQKPFF